MSKIKLASATDMRGDQRVTLIARTTRRATIYRLKHTEISGETTERVVTQLRIFPDFAGAMNAFAQTVTEQFQ